MGRWSHAGLPPELSVLSWSKTQPSLRVGNGEVVE